MCSFWLVEALTRAGRTDPSRLAGGDAESGTAQRGAKPGHKKSPTL
jgi:hypothetical protein